MSLSLGSDALACARMVRAAPVVLTLVCFACHDTPITAPARGHIAIASGNAQRGAPGEPLGQPLVAVVRNRTGAPVPGVRVTWHADDGGVIAPAEGVTDGTGGVSATWTLGGDAAPHRARAIADGYDAVEFTASTVDQLPLDIIQPLTLQTYDGSGQTVHPDFVATSPEWAHGGPYLFITPYPNGNANFENPSLYESGDLVAWSAPAGIGNPIVPQREGYNSDPDALFVPERNELWLYYRQVTSENVIRLTTSSDGVHWSTPSTVAHAPNHEIISPSVVRLAPDEWLMWSVNGNVGCSGATAGVELRRSTNGMDWSAPEPVSMSQPGVYPWHIDVQWIASRGEFWALFNGKTAGSCTTGAVYLATSRDGVQWTTFPSPVLARGALPELRDVVYRSTLSYDPASDAVTIWYSGARYDGSQYIWRSGVQRRLRADLFTTVAAPAKSAAVAPVALPPLTDFP